MRHLTEPFSPRILRLNTSSNFDISKSHITIKFSELPVANKFNVLENAKAVISFAFPDKVCPPLIVRNSSVSSAFSSS